MNYRISIDLPESANAAAFAELKKEINSIIRRIDRELSEASRETAARKNKKRSGSSRLKNQIHRILQTRAMFKLNGLTGMQSVNNDTLRETTTNKDNNK